MINSGTAILEGLCAQYWLKGRQPEALLVHWFVIWGQIEENFP